MSRQNLLDNFCTAKVSGFVGEQGKTGVKRLSSLDEANVKLDVLLAILKEKRVFWIKKTKKPGEYDSPGLTKPCYAYDVWLM